MPAQCCACHATTGDGTYLCTPCLRDLREGVSDVSWLDAELEVTYLRLDRFTAQTSTSRSAERPLPWNDRASRVRAELRSTLAMWARAMATHDQDARDPYQPENAGRWLARNLVALRTHPDAGAGYHELTRAVNRAKETVDRPLDLLAYGVCDVDDCVGFLYAPPGREVIECPKCGTEHKAAERRAWMMAYVRGQKGTSAEVAGMLRMAGVRVTSNAVRKMGDNQKVEVLHSTTSEGRAVRLYKVSDVLDAVANRYQRRK